MDTEYSFTGILPPMTDEPLRWEGSYTNKEDGTVIINIVPHIDLNYRFMQILSIKTQDTYDVRGFHRDHLAMMYLACSLTVPNITQWKGKISKCYDNVPLNHNAYKNQQIIGMSIL